MKIKHTKLTLATLSGLSLALGSATLHAQIAWDGGGGDSDYSNPLNWVGDIIPGDGNASGALIGNSSDQTVIYSSATSYTSTGAGKANSLLVGTGANGVGSLTLSGSADTLTFGGDGYNNAAWIGSTSGNTNATGTVTVSAGKLAITGGTDASINLGVHITGTSGGTKSGTLLINGGTIEVGRRLLMGANRDTSVGILTISSGTLDMKSTGLSGEGDLGMIRFGTGNNTVNLDGGTVIFRGFHTSGATNARSTINMNGTTLKAGATIADLFNGTTTNTNLRLKDGGLVLDTNGFNVTINDALTQETGHTAILRKEGAGTLTITGAQANRTGTTAVNGGTLRVTTTGSLGTGATTVSNSGSILDLARNDTWGNHSGSAQALTIQAGGLVTNGTAGTGFNTLQTLALDGGELRVTGSARALADGDLYKFEAYGIRDSITVTGTAASSITNPGNIANAGINIGGHTDLGGGVGSDLTIHVASAAELTISAVLKNNYDATAFNPLANGLVKTGDGTMVLSGTNRYTGPTTVNEGSLVITGAVASTAVFVNALLSGSGTMANATLSGSGFITPGNSAGIMTAAAIDPNGGLGFKFEFAAANTPPAWNMPAASGNDVLRLTAAAPFTAALAGSNAIGIYLNVASLNLGDTFTGGFFTDNNADFLGAISSASFQYFLADANGAIGYNGVDYDPYTGPLGFRVATVAQTADFGAGEVDGFVTRITVIPEPSAALLGGLGLLALLRRRAR